jgi:hypothetical protein
MRFELLAYCWLRPSSSSSNFPLNRARRSIDREVYVCSGRPASMPRSKEAGGVAIAAMFLDLRGSSLATDWSPYDALFLFDRFALFRRIAPVTAWLWRAGRINHRAVRLCACWPSATNKFMVRARRSARRGTSAWGHKSELQTKSFVPLENVIVVFAAKGDVWFRTDRRRG